MSVELYRLSAFTAFIDRRYESQVNILIIDGLSQQHGVELTADI